MEKEAIDKIMEGIRFESYPQRPTGGQTVGMPSRGVKLIHEDLDFVVTANSKRSVTENREIAIMLFELYLSTY